MIHEDVRLEVAVLTKNLVLYREGDKIFYCRHLWIPRSSIIGEFSGLVMGPYFLCRVLDYRKHTGEMRVHIDPTKLNVKDYGIWLTHNHEFFSELPLKYIWI